MDPEGMEALFDSIAPTYDRTNRLISLGFHTLWNKRLIRKLVCHLPDGRPTVRFLDLCCGTGEIAFRYAQALSHPSQKISIDITGVDFSHNMLEEAKKRARSCHVDVDRSRSKPALYSCTLPNHSIQFIRADVTELPFDTHSYDQAAVAYGIRNVENRSKLFAELRRVLRPGGTAVVLELTRPNWACVRALHSMYTKHIIPRIGHLVCGSQVPYQYLAKSIQELASPTLLQLEMQTVGFHDVQIDSMTFGIATLFCLQNN